MAPIPSCPSPASPRRAAPLRLAAVVALLLGLVLGQIAAGRDEVGAATGPTAGPTTTPTAVETTLPPPARGAPGIIPEPNSGHAPDDPGDRGGWQQWGVLVAILGGLGVIAGLVVRESRRARRRRGAA